MPEALVGEDGEPSKEPSSFRILAGGGFTICLCLSIPLSLWLCFVLASITTLKYVVYLHTLHQRSDWQHECICKLIDVWRKPSIPDVLDRTASGTSVHVAHNRNSQAKQVFYFQNHET
jgi:hypothetical protein